MINDKEPEESRRLVTNEINYFDDQSQQNAIIPVSNDQALIQNKETSQVYKYQAFSEFLIAKLNRRYDLRPRPDPSRPTKNVTINEPPIKTIETKTTII